MNLDYREDGRSLQQATLAGQADIQLATKTRVGGPAPASENMDIALAPDGSVSSLVGAGQRRSHAAGHRRHRGAHDQVERAHRGGRTARA